MAYVTPTDADLTTRYPAFAAVDEDTIDYWLAEAASLCAGWSDDTRARGEMAHAAHRMAELGLGGQAGQVPAGVTGFRSGDFAAQVSDSVAARTGYEATVYGREFRQLQRRNFAGPRLAGFCP
jgi:hypothetical protein